MGGRGFGICESIRINKIRDESGLQTIIFDLDAFGIVICLEKNHSFITFVKIKV